MSAKASGGRTPWFDDGANLPLIAEEAQRLESFVQAVADGQIETAELKSQEGRLVAAMKEVEPLLSDELHGKVTKLLCELAAYDMMQVLHSLGQARQQTKFRG